MRYVDPVSRGSEGCMSWKAKYKRKRSRRKGFRFLWFRW
jgi:hypothetical protein